MSSVIDNIVVDTGTSNVTHFVTGFRLGFQFTGVRVVSRTVFRAGGSTGYKLLVRAALVICDQTQISIIF